MSTPKQLKASREYYHANKDRARAANAKFYLKKKYGISPDIYLNMLANQNGVCAICSKPETVAFKGRIRALSVDHDHETGKIRGLLCHGCNIALGHLRTKAILEKAKDYLSSFCDCTGRCLDCLRLERSTSY